MNQWLLLPSQYFVRCGKPGPFLPPFPTFSVAWTPKCRIPIKEKITEITAMERPLVIISRISPNGFNNLFDLRTENARTIISFIFSGIRSVLGKTARKYRINTLISTFTYLKRSQLTNITCQIETVPDLEREVNIVTGNIQQLLGPKN